MKSFFKENIVLVTGVVLPVLLTVIFFISSQAVQEQINPPQYEMVFVNHQNYAQPYLITLRNQQVRLVHQNNLSENPNYNTDSLRLYVYDPVKHESREIDLPGTDQNDQKLDVAVPALASKIVIGAVQSPDGYRFEYLPRGNNNLITEIFGGSYRHNSGQQMYKGSKRIKIPSFEQHSSLFIGWIIKDKDENNE